MRVRVNVFSRRELYTTLFGRLYDRLPISVVLSVRRNYWTHVVITGYVENR